MECGKDRYITGDRQIQKLIEEEQLCFVCAFWKLEAKKTHDVVIGHHVYVIGREPADMANYHRKQNLGMGGRKFVIEFFDGRQVVTHNLWSGGPIPKRYWEDIPDTARFGGGAKFVNIGETGAWDSSE
jgi:hypothetical protein